MNTNRRSSNNNVDDSTGQRGLTPYDIFTDERNNRRTTMSDNVTKKSPGFSATYDRFLKRREKEKKSNISSVRAHTQTRFGSSGITASQAQINETEYVPSTGYPSTPPVAPSISTPVTPVMAYPYTASPYVVPQVMPTMAANMSTAYAMPQVNPNLTAFAMPNNAPAAPSATYPSVAPSSGMQALYGGYTVNANQTQVAPTNAQASAYTKLATPPLAPPNETVIRTDPQNTAQGNAYRILFNVDEKINEGDPRYFASEQAKGDNSKTSDTNGKPLTAAEVKEQSKMDINYFNAAAAQAPSMPAFFHFKFNGDVDRSEIMTYPSYRDYLYTQLYRATPEKILSEKEYNALRTETMREQSEVQPMRRAESSAVGKRGIKVRTNPPSRKLEENAEKRKLSSGGKIFIAIYVLIVLLVALIIIVLNAKPNMANASEIDSENLSVTETLRSDRLGETRSTDDLIV
ncbi:MAG: hypothetical protein LBE09_05390 [Christensenellaceae bacterium]|jgi:hypothetical protein|nr:hypothetical protein [Christensenellaceae bacterium]